MAGRLAFLLFGDQSLDTHAFLAGFCRQPGQGILAKAFLHQAGEALRREIESLPRLERAKLPLFKTLQQLNEKYHAQSIKHTGVDAALLCVTQLAHYIDHAEKNYEDVTKHDHTFLVGLCSGLFAAAAVASTPSLSTLVPVAVQAVLMAFRTGLHVAKVAERLCPAVDHSGSWTYVFPSQTEETARHAITEFCRSNAIPEASKIYISAVAASNVAISGPPPTLEAFASSGTLGRSASIPVYGPYHAAHLHRDADIRGILQLDNAAVRDAFYNTKPRSAVMSCENGTWFSETTTEALFAAAAYEILNEPLQLQGVLDGCVDMARDFTETGMSCLVIPFGPAQNGTTLANMVRSKTDLETVLRASPEFTAASTWSHIPASIGNHGSSGKDRLAIVGMAGRFPDAASHEKLWELLVKGLDVHRVVPDDRFPHETHVDPTGKAINTSHTPYGCWIEKPGMFDPRFFNMSPREALQTDPMQRMALTTAYEALEMSGYVPNRTPSTRLDRIGTFYGQTSDDWREINAAQEVDTYFITGGVRAFGPGRINYHFGFSGPSLNIDTACSSSAAALNVACTALWARDCDTAIVGGLSCMTNSDIFAGLSRGQFLSKTGSCQTFDNDADGYCRGDSCASVVVKRLADAEADGDNILAIVLGTATNHSADAISITHPHGPTQSVLSSAILDEAGVDPLDVDYVEMHGTGTQAGDGTEMASVTSVFAPAHRRRPAGRPLYLGAVKANIGHGEAASGVTALIKVLLMLQKNAIPPHVGIKKEINKGFPADLSARNVNIAFHTTPFRRTDGKPRRVFVNNFSAAGGNTGLLLEDAPAKPAVTKSDPRKMHVVTVTGKSKAAMIRNAERLVAWMSEHPDTPVADVAYTTTARRIQHYWRMNASVADLAGAQRAIQARLNEANFVPAPAHAPKVAFLFTGQGSHYAGLGCDLYANHAVFRESIDEFNQLARIHGFPSFLPLIRNREHDVQALSPVVVQLGLACFEMALARLWASWGMLPAVVLGHSLGEYAALHVAGVLSASDAIYLVGARARLLVEKCTAGTHAMLAVQGSVAAVTEALGSAASQINIACVNGPRETVLSGEAGQMATIAQQLAGGGTKCTQLKVPFAFHSAQVDPILDDFASLASAVRFHAPTVPVISPLLGKLVGVGADTTFGPAYLRNHARDAVNFLGGLVAAQTAGAIDDKTVWLEVGPHPVCANMVKAAFGATTIAVPTLRRNEATYTTMSASLCTLHTAGMQLDWSEFHRDFADSVRLLDLPTYAFDEKNYWLQYEGGWSLSKNRAALALPAVPAGPAKPKLSTSSIHKVLREEVRDGVAHIDAESDLARSDLRKALEGHLVNGTPLCPSTLYADMAMTLGDYAYRLVRPDTAADKKLGLNVGDVEVGKTLIFDDSKTGHHMLRIETVAHVADGHADLTFVTGEGKQRTVHATCRVYYGDVEQWSAEFERVNYLIRGRMDALQAAENQGIASKIGRGIAYKLFTALVDYAPRYRGMEEVVLDSRTCEAMAKVRFQTTNDEDEGSFFFNPYWIDSMCHVSGFIVNATDAVDSRDQVYISHGWGSLRFLAKPDPSKTYTNYIRMQPVKGTTMYAGDVYVFDGDRIIGVCGEVRFAAIPRKVLNLVLPPRGATAAPTAPAAPATASKAKTVLSKKVVTPANISKVNQKLSARSVVSQVLDILAKEVGVAHDELEDNIAFADLGVDSLMSLTVSGRIREDMDLDLHSNAFVDFPTIGTFKGYLAQFETAETLDSGISSSDSESDEMKSDDSDLTTPMDESEDGSVNDGGDCASGDAARLRKAVRETISAEMGVDVDEIMATPDLADLGMDSLMSLQILGALREKTGVDIASDLFVTNPSLADVERALGIENRPAKRVAVVEPAPVEAAPVVTATPAPAPVVVSAAASIPPSAHDIHAYTSVTLGQKILLGPADPVIKLPPPTDFVDPYPHRVATSLLLHGSQRTATQNLFMIPDGSGCATSYTEIANVGSGWAVWGLFSPFMKTPEEYICGVYGMATKFIAEMKRRQPQGPYNLAGWSAGGVIAFEIINQLVRDGEAVSKVVFIDSPCPVTIEPLPKGLHAWFASIGLLGDGDPGKVPPWLLPHFAASVTALSNYSAVPIPKDKCPQATVIWCEDGVCHLPSDPRPEPYPEGHALFLLDNRTDFGPNRWDEFLDESKMTFHHMPGNHFSMMHGDLAKQLSGFMRAALGA